MARWEHYEQEADIRVRAFGATRAEAFKQAAPAFSDPTAITIGLAWISFGGTAAIVTSMGLILGLEAAASSRQAILSALLIVALADNLSDSLSVHVYQDAEQLESREAFRSILANFVTRLLVALSFVVLVITLPSDLLAAATIAWGFLLLALLTFRIARARRARRQGDREARRDCRNRARDEPLARNVDCRQLRLRLGR